MSNSKLFLVIGAIAVASLVVGGATPASAGLVGSSFNWQSLNFQGTGAAPITFGTPTFVPGSEVTISSSTTTAYPAIPGFLEGGHEFVNIGIDTHSSPAPHAGNDGYLQSSLLDPSQYLISGLNWGPGEQPGVFTGLIFVSFDIDGVPLALNDPNPLGIPIAVNPVTGFPAVPIDVTGAPVDLIPWDTIDLVGIPMHQILVGISDLTFADVQTVNSMHLGFEAKQVPEPASMMLLGTGLASVLLLRRRKR